MIGNVHCRLHIAAAVPAQIEDQRSYSLLIKFFQIVAHQFTGIFRKRSNRQDTDAALYFAEYRAGNFTSLDLKIQQFILPLDLHAYGRPFFTYDLFPQRIAVKSRNAFFIYTDDLITAA